MDSITLDHLEIRSPDKSIGPEHNVEVRVAWDGQAFVGLVAMVMPKIAQINAVAADYVERGDVSFLKSFVAGGQDQGIDAS